VMLLPRELDPVDSGRNVPLPPERPRSFALADDDGTVDPGTRQVPLPHAKPAALPAAKPTRRTRRAQ